MNPKKFISEVYHFLQVDPNFTPSIIEKGTNKTGNKVYKTKVPILNEILFRGYKKLNHFPSLVENMENLNLLNFFHKLSLRNRYQISSPKLNRGKKMNLSEKTRREIYELYKEDIHSLEILLEKDLSLWKPQR